MRSINFVTAHDGFTLQDLVSYNDKHNDANQRGQPRRQQQQSVAGTAGSRGPTDDAAVNALRELQKRNFLATLLLSQGVPMLLAGDEIGAHPAAATTMPTARTTSSPGSIGARTRRNRRCWNSCAA